MTVLSRGALARAVWALPLIKNKSVSSRRGGQCRIERVLRLRVVLNGCELGGGTTRHNRGSLQDEQQPAAEAAAPPLIRDGETELGRDVLDRPQEAVRDDGAIEGIDGHHVQVEPVERVPNRLTELGDEALGLPSVGLEARARGLGEAAETEAAELGFIALPKRPEHTEPPVVQQRGRRCNPRRIIAAVAEGELRHGGLRREGRQSPPHREGARERARARLLRFPPPGQQLLRVGSRMGGRGRAVAGVA
mmetsp:Transcript_126875/g.405795  ORF Transcript_126875/g.405795 Transcript_126875/m.405795 type:complete len:249 (-) Transcript_126875:586-1332(-)